jgi:hypothetical protein
MTFGAGEQHIKTRLCQPFGTGVGNIRRAASFALEKQWIS